MLTPIQVGVMSSLKTINSNRIKLEEKENNAKVLQQRKIKKKKIPKKLLSQVSHIQ